MSILLFIYFSRVTFLLCLYIDNLIILGHNLKINTLFKKVMTNSFEMTNIKLKSYFLSIEIIQVDNGIFMFIEICNGRMIVHPTNFQTMINILCYIDLYKTIYRKGS